MRGVVYILTNEAMPGYVKVGKTTTSPAQRMRELDTSGVPLPFECFYAAEVSDWHQAERLLHDAFADVRVRSRREFFEISPERVASALRLAALQDVTPRDDVVEDAEDERALNEARRRRGRFNFKIVGIQPGTLLTLAKDETKTCVVIDNRRVLYRNQEMSLSQAALQAIHELGYTWQAVSGPENWEVDGQTLDELRRSVEEGEE